MTHIGPESPQSVRRHSARGGNPNAAPSAVSVSEREGKALKALADVYSQDYPMCLNFKGVANRSGLEQKHVRRSVRALARKGLALYEKGLWSEDGYPAGAGYRCTKAGAELAATLPDNEAA